MIRNRRSRGKTGRWWLLAACGFVLPQWSHAEPAGTQQTGPAREALESLNPLIGEWRGTGQVRRGSAQGAWRQNSEFLWDFSGEEPAVRYLVREGKYVAEGRITYVPESKQFRFQVKSPAGDERTYFGKWDKNQLFFASAADESGEQHRLTITALNEKRTLVLHEKTSSTGDVFFRLGEVGYTREGTRLAIAGGGQRECIVTGGTGTTAVTYMGETYYVCCSGCKQAFDDDPAGIIAEFKERLNQRRQQQNQPR